MHQRDLPDKVSGTLVRYSAAGKAQGWPACPRCRSALKRVPRRMIDRLLSLFVPLRRYRCRAIACQWQGTLRVESSKHSAGENDKQCGRPIDTY